MILSESFPLEFRYGNAGYELYHEIHNSLINQIIHGLGMPFVVYGMFKMMGAIFANNKKTAGYIQLGMFIAFTIYYMTFDPIGAIISIGLYGYVLEKVMGDTEYSYVTTSGRFKHFTKGFVYMTGSLLIQEFIGHTYFEGTNSNLWELPNSIAISPIFGANSLVFRDYWPSLF